MAYFDVYSLNRCRLCLSHVNPFADISFADPFPFLHELPEADHKWTAAVVRTQRGQELIRTIRQRQDAAIETRAVQTSSVKRWDNSWKQKNRVHLLQIASDRRIGLPTPDFHCALPSVAWLPATLHRLKAKVFNDITLGLRNMWKPLLFPSAHQRAVKRLKRRKNTVPSRKSTEVIDS
jgi:hypothetical protein